MSKRANIFISYRRGDSAGYTGRLFDHLRQRFPERVFMDLDTIQPGSDFVEMIEQAVGCCQVLIVMIGPEWLNLTDAAGRRRLDDPKDFVRLEIATALDRDFRDILIIPVLVEGADMPRPEDLPADLAKLTRLNAIELSDVRWTFDVDRLIQVIEKFLQDKAPSLFLSAVTPQPAPSPLDPARRKRTARARAWMAVNVLVLLSLAGWIGWNARRQPAPQPLQEIRFVESPKTTEKPQALPAVSEKRLRPARPSVPETAAKQSPQGPTIKKRTTEALKTAGKRITSLLWKVKRDSPLRH
jgi:hypothetical protein